MLSSKPSPSGKTVLCISAALAMGAVLWLCCTRAVAATGTIRTTDGTVYTGDITETRDSYTVNVRGIVTTIAKSDVVVLQFSGDAEQEYQDRLARLDARDVRGRVKLARDAFDHHHYDIAQRVLDSAAGIDPDDEDVTAMQDTIKSQIRLEQAKAGAQPGTTRPSSAASPDNLAAGAANGITAAQTSDRALLSIDDVNFVRQAELQKDDNVPVRITADVRKRFAQQQNLLMTQFNSEPPIQQAMEILDKGDALMRSQVRIMGDPQSLSDFKRFIQPMILAGCATSNCHGGNNGANFILIPQANNDQAAYTNFYILLKYVQRSNDPDAGGMFAPPERRMISRGNAADSLLVQYGLPPSIAEVDHPKIPGSTFNGIFRSRQDPRYLQVVEWMDHTLKRPEPDYLLDYHVPVGGRRGGVRGNGPTTQESSGGAAGAPSSTAPTTRPLPPGTIDAPRP